MTIKDWLHTSTMQLVDASTSPRLDALLFLEHILKTDRAHILAHHDDPLDTEAHTALDLLVTKRLDHTPLAYLTGIKDFYGLEFNVGQDVLIPRPETELIIEHIIKNVSGSNTLIDIGTGSGAIAISIKKNCPELAVTATDISQAALAVAKKNAQKHTTDITFLQSDLFASITDTYDFIVANLPYVPDEMRTKKDISHEPAQALFSGVDGLDLYTLFIPQAIDHLNKSGSILIEHLPSQTNAISTMASSNNLQHDPISDYASRLYV